MVDKIDHTFFPAGTVGHMGLEQAGAHHRRQGQRDNSRHRNRADYGKGKFREQGTGQSALKADRHINRDQNDGHRDNRADQLACRQQCGRNGLHTVFKMAVDVFDDNNGVVDHQADSKHQRQQGQ